MMEKEAHYFKRTIKHIHRVQENALYLILNHQKDLHLDTEMCRLLMFDVMHHDHTKFAWEQFNSYVDFTWAKLGEIKGAKLPDTAWRHHYMNENHHPEGFENVRTHIPTEIVIEMACDLQAMAQEFGEPSGRGYFDNVWVKKQEKKFFHADWPRIKQTMEKCFECFEEGVKSAMEE
jgi:hypothetical protein